MSKKIYVTGKWTESVGQSQNVNLLGPVPLSPKAAKSQQQLAVVSDVSPGFSANGINAHGRVLHKDRLLLLRLI